MSIKVLLSNGVTGTLIGTGGKAIKEMMAETGSRVIVSANTEPFPGTSDRVILITGDADAITLTLTLIWEMVALIAGAKSEKDIDWSPTAVVAALGNSDAVEVSAKLTVPAAAGGIILGRGGANIRSFGEDSGAKVQMNGKDEAMLTQERVLTISGTAGSCIKCTELIMQKLAEAPEVIPYVNRGTSYGVNAGGFGMPYGAPYGVFPGAAGGMKRGYSNGGANNGGAPGNGSVRYNKNSSNQQQQQQQQQAPTPAEADITITLAVPDELVGNILGKQGVTMREIISLSGARVALSSRGEFVEGTTNRLVTITGSPVCAQTAHMFITQKLQSPALPRRPRVEA